MDKVTQDRLFDKVEHIPTPKVNPRHLKKELRDMIDDLIEQGFSRQEAEHRSWEKFKEIMNKI